MKPQPNDYCKVETQEEYDIAVAAMEKAGFNSDHDWRYGFERMQEYQESLVLIDNDGDIITDSGVSRLANPNQLTIPQLREYLNEQECAYEVGDVVEVDGCLRKVDLVDGDAILTRNGIQFESNAISQITAHYKLQEKV